MKKLFLVLISIFLVYQINAQNQNIADEDCPPVPWVNAELLENGDVEVNWDIPCDTCNSLKYRVSTVGGFNPCAGDIPWDGVITPIFRTSNTGFTYTDLYYDILGFAVRAEYDSCVSSWTFSNVVYYDSAWYSQTFQLTVNISLEGGGNPEGANVIVDGANCFYEALLYEEQADEVGETLFAEVMHGTYDIIVSNPGYHTAVVEDFYLWQNDTVDVELKIYYVNIDEKKERNQINIFPNPASDQINIQSEETILQIEMVNCLGQNVFNTEPNQRELLVNTSDFITGVYLVKINTVKGVTIKRIILNNFN